MAGVVRKKRRMKRTMLMIKQRIHQENPPTDRCSLWENGDVTITQHRAKSRPQLPSNLTPQLRDEYLVLKALQRRAESPHCSAVTQTDKSLFVENPFEHFFY